MSEALAPDYRTYDHFNDFFTRALKPGAREIDPADSGIISPVDGVISQLGDIIDGDLYQAKNHYYSLDALLAHDKMLAEQFRDGVFATLYLSPGDYHRIHMPVDGRLVRTIYVPGRLFAVNAHTTRVVSGLFARNERIICLFETPAGPMALVMIGAINVGSMQTVWAGEMTPATWRIIQGQDYSKEKDAIRLSKGEEMGRFNMGSTVILLFAKGRVTLRPHLRADGAARMGMSLAEIVTK